MHYQLRYLSTLKYVYWCIFITVIFIARIRQGQKKEEVIIIFEQQSINHYLLYLEYTRTHSRIVFYLQFHI